MTIQNKFSILLPYYNRPNMIRFGLKSLQEQNYSNWELLVCDDGSIHSAEEVVNEYFPNDSRVSYVNTQTTAEEKQQHGSSFGKYLNDFLMNSDSDVSLVLCDDDALCENYLSSLDNWYTQNPDKQYSFCDVIPYNPFSIKSLTEIDRSASCSINSNGSTDIVPSCRVDSSQVSWRTNLFREQNIKFPYPQTSSLDAVLFDQLYNLCGSCPFNNIVGQYKGFHQEQLGTRKDLNTIDINFLPL
jgi:glycosyltransferase involved in cell wall biosynthesis